MIFEQEVLPLFEEHRGDYLSRARGVAFDLARLWGEITVDDVRQQCPPPPSVDPRVMGAIFRSREWELTGYQKSTRSECHGRPIAKFAIRSSNK